MIFHAESKGDHSSFPVSACLCLFLRNHVWRGSVTQTCISTGRLCDYSAHQSFTRYIVKLLFIFFRTIPVFVLSWNWLIRTEFLYFLQSKRSRKCSPHLQCMSTELYFSSGARLGKIVLQCKSLYGIITFFVLLKSTKIRIIQKFATLQQRQKA